MTDDIFGLKPNLRRQREEMLEICKRYTNQSISTLVLSKQIDQFLERLMNDARQQGAAEQREKDAQTAKSWHFKICTKHEGDLSCYIHACEGIAEAIRTQGEEGAKE